MNKQKETKKTDPYEKTPEDLNKKHYNMTQEVIGEDK